jgi:hypothetical protein
MISPSFFCPAIAVKKSQGISPGGQYHLKGVKLLQVHTQPPSVVVGNTFSLRGVVYNNSSSTITFSNGTCNSALSANFNKNVLTENRGIALCSTPQLQVTLKPGGHSAIQSPNLPGIVYKARVPGMTNATMIFNYGVKTADGKFTTVDKTSRLYTFNILNMAGKAYTTHTPAHNHIKGVKLLHVHTTPSKIVVGNTFSLQGIVYNNSSATIAFANGTCNSPSPPLFITFNGTVMTETKGAATTCKPQQVSLNPGEKSDIQSPNLYGMTYRATTPGITNTTMIFNYGVKTATSKTPVSDSISRFFAFKIQPDTQLQID